MIRIAAPLGLALALAACNQGPSVSLTNASPEDVAKAMKASGFADLQKPGMWEVSMQTSAAVEGVPAEQKQMLETMLNRPATTISRCMTVDDLKKADAARAPGGEMGQKCTFKHFKQGGGKLDALMTCTGGPSESTVTMTGTYAADSTTVETAVDTKGPPDQGSLKMTMKMTSRRTGDCPAGK